MNRTLNAALLGVATAATITLTGCAASSGGDSFAPSSTVVVTVTGTPASGPHDDADIAFATDMIPHHAQAVEMADMALGQASSAEVKDLAIRIKAAQAPEIDAMSGWLAGWGEPIPATSGMSGMDHAMGTGMMSDDEMQDLAAATGAAFDRMWVTMMIEHHTGALEMAKTELATGRNPDARALAQSITTSQTAEIATMRQVLTRLPAA